MEGAGNTPRRTRLATLYQNWLPPFLVVAVAAWLTYVSFVGFYPPIGAYIAVLGFLAVAVTIWPPESNWAKATWLVVFFSVMGFEIQNLYHDRSENQQHQVQDRKDEDDRFGQILKNNQKTFDATMQKMR